MGLFNAWFWAPPGREGGLGYLSVPLNKAAAATQGHSSGGHRCKLLTVITHRGGGKMHLLQRLYSTELVLDTAVGVAHCVRAQWRTVPSARLDLQSRVGDT